MGLRDSIAQGALRRVHVLLVETPGWAEVRMAVEGELRLRGWKAATSPADADILVVCGAPGHELASVCARVWSQMPGPRSRVTVDVTRDVSTALDSAADELGDDDAQRRDARARPTSMPQGLDEHSSVDHAGMDHPGMPGMDHSGMDHSDMPGMDHSGMATHDHTTMSGPSGIPLASGAPDRDGLEMDVLHVPLGPVLPHWHAGLVVDCVLHGDVIGQAEAKVLPAAGVPVGLPPDGSAGGEQRRVVVRNCDQAARVLALAGWPSAATRAQRIRDAALVGAALADLGAQLESLVRTVGRSRLLRWTLRGIPAAIGAVGSGEPVTVRERMLDLLREAAQSAGGASERHAASDVASQQELLRALPALIEGTDVATARLIIAAASLDTASLAISGAMRHE
ncbi:hypothetical protein EEJ31_09915 [Cryobacterium tepidiphilum]|uniref:Uncharacterized protein n=2 Tax=Cryobacterium tepidiphilum TaxID=2486026 RepID=A0A3M8L3P7_9MICO|nr:hypothetical protein EEJ31_09915 [Cryobacterium tepidiphilum]